MKHTGTITPTEMRVINRSAILDLIRRDSPISRSVIASRLDVSLPTVMRIVDDLEEEGLVRSMGISEWSGGRRRALLEFNALGLVLIGIDLGGTEFYGAVADMGGHILSEAALPHPGACGMEGYPVLVELIEKLLEQARQAGLTVRGIGVGTPGVTDYEQGVVRWAPTLNWRDLPLRRMLSDRFNLPVIIDNDVNLSALGELWFGEQANLNNLVLISVGMGIGAGIVIDGAIYRGSHQAAGEIGYLMPGAEYIGQDTRRLGATDTLAAGMGIVEQARRALANQRSPAELENLQAEDVFEASERGEEWALKIISQAADALSLAVAATALCFDPDIIVLGGDLSKRYNALVAPVMERVSSAIGGDIALVTSSLGRRAAVMGAITNVMYHTAQFYVLRSMS